MKPFRRLSAARRGACRIWWWPCDNRRSSEDRFELEGACDGATRFAGEKAATDPGRDAWMERGRLRSTDRRGMESFAVVA